MAYFEEEQEYNKPFSLKIWAKMFPYIKEYKTTLIFILILMVLSALIDIAFPLFQRYAIQEFIEKSTTNGMVPYVLLFTGGIALQTIFVLLFVRNTIMVEMCIGKSLKKATFVKLQKLSFSYYNTTPVGFMMARVMSDTNRIGGMVAWGLMDIAWALCYVIGVVIAMFLLDIKITLYVLAAVPFIVAVTIYFQKKMLNINRKIRKTNSHMTGVFNEGITGSKTSKTLLIEDKNTENFKGVTDQMYRRTLKYTMVNAIFLPIVVTISSTAVALVIADGGKAVLNTTLEIATLSTLVTYALNIFEPIQNIARIFADFVSTQANIERVVSLLETEPNIVDTDEVVAKYGDNFTPKTENWEKLIGDIEFKDVWFKYPDGGDYILKDFNLKIKAGTTVAIVGETGAGKSTLVNLACRFFEPTKGQVLIDGVDYRKRSQLWLHSNIGYVLQNPHLFSGSVKENLRYGRLDATDRDIIDAAKLVSADKVIAKMDKGYDSDVGESGDRLSTGEKQLLSFARAVIADPAIFVLDEATSSIDTQTEALIQDAISHLLNNRTSFLIAHRLSTIRKADLILVVKDGDVIEQGTHSELLAQKGYYSTLYLKQFEDELGEKYLDKK